MSAPLPLGPSDRREDVGVIVQRANGHGQERHVSACRDAHSLWVEIAGPQGGNAWQMTPKLARDLADHLERAADAAEAMR